MASRFLSFLCFLSSFAFAASATCKREDSSVLPIPQVDLGYSVVQAIANGTDYYSFYNIRYAEPPLGELRFAAPIPPKTINRTVNDGSQSVICPQADPEWVLQLSNLTALPVDPRTSEDCLFLDVVVPQAAFNSRQAKGIMPVLVWIYGGGYTGGEKSANVSGLLAEATKSISTEGTRRVGGMVFVAMNYRLGLFGWLSGSAVQSNGTANAGLYDQRLALEWVQQNIHLFGGDPDNVTIMGESAGGGSIMHHITAYGGNPPGGTPFQKAILQSPGFGPTPSAYQQEIILQNMLNRANISTIEEARSLDTQVLQSLNQAMVGAAPYGSFLFNPVVDGSFVPGLPGELLLQGAYNKSISVMIGHNSNEGASFVNPTTSSNNDFYDVVRLLFSAAPTPIFNYMIQELYPPIFNDTTGRYPYTNNYERTKLFFAESIFTCNSDYFGRAYGNQTYNYVFAVPPGIHGEDVPYTFYVPGGSSTNYITGEPIDPTLATTLQDYITSFAVTGNPNIGSQGMEEGATQPQFDRYGAEGRAQFIISDGIAMGTDPAHNDRCLWWQKALYY